MRRPARSWGPGYLDALRFFPSQAALSCHHEMRRALQPCTADRARDPGSRGRPGEAAYCNRSKLTAAARGGVQGEVAEEGDDAAAFVRSACRRSKRKRQIRIAVSLVCGMDDQRGSGSARGGLGRRNGLTHGGEA